MGDSPAPQYDLIALAISCLMFSIRAWRGLELPRYGFWP